jgi:hypothetical protein
MKFPQLVVGQKTPLARLQAAESERTEIVAVQAHNRMADGL